MSIERAREQIDKIDSKIVELLDRRVKYVKQIGKLKENTGANFFDAARQRRIVSRLVSESDGGFPKAALKKIFVEIMSASLSLEKPIRIGFLGPRATFSHQAALNEFGTSSKYIDYNSIHDIFVGLDKSWVEYGVVPIENSTGGIIHLTLDMFLEYELSICSEIMLPIKQNLLSQVDLTKIEKIYSHPQSFSQCQIWLKENLPNAKQIEVASTAQGVKTALARKHAAAIGSELAAKLYKIKILERGIEDIKDNCTRFLVIGKHPSSPTGHDKTSLMFSVKDKPGALHSVLAPFTHKSINLTKIESRPTRRRAWEYVFFVDLEGHIEDKIVKKAVAEMGEHCTFIRILGSYPREVNIE